MIDLNSGLIENEIAQTYANLCAIYSDSGKHEIALSYIVKGVQILEQEYEEKRLKLDEDEDKEAFIQLVVTAYSNAAVEYEYVLEFSNSLLNYQKAQKISEMHLGPLHALTKMV